LFYKGIKHLAVSGLLNFFPSFEKLPAFLGGGGPRPWIVDGQRITHR